MATKKKSPEKSEPEFEVIETTTPARKHSFTTENLVGYIELGEAVTFFISRYGSFMSNNLRIFGDEIPEAIKIMRRMLEIYDAYNLLNTSTRPI